MKKLLFGIITLLLVCLCLPADLPAQLTMNPNGQYLYYTYTFVTSRAYAGSRTDTIPNSSYGNWFQSTTQSTRLGGASHITLEIDPADSMYAVVYVDELKAGTWTNILEDSIATATGVAKEFAVRSQNSEKTAILGGSFRARIYTPAWHTQGVADATDSPTYTGKWLWKP